MNAFHTRVSILSSEALTPRLPWQSIVVKITSAPCKDPLQIPYPIMATIRQKAKALRKTSLILR
jgi:3-methyladenine DNA glycosylase AlkC